MQVRVLSLTPVCPYGQIGKGGSLKRSVITIGSNPIRGTTIYGRVVERSITTVLKTVGSKGSVGSNPTSSSIFKGDNYDHRRILEMDSRKRTIAT
jgi:hypothetical protein